MGKKILVVDDEADVRAFITALLNKHGYQTQSANNGSEALEVRRPAEAVDADVLEPLD